MKNIFLLFILVFSSSTLAQQLYGPQRGQRGYIPPPKYEASVYITTLNAYEELEKVFGGMSHEKFEKWRVETINESW